MHVAGQRAAHRSGEPTLQNAAGVADEWWIARRAHPGGGGPRRASSRLVDEALDYLGSKEGAALLRQLEERGLSERQAIDAVLLTSAATFALQTTPATALLVELAHAVAARTGLRPSIAQLVVSLVVSRVQSRPAVQPRTS
jgi:hypothetical protein